MNVVVLADTHLRSLPDGSSKPGLPPAAEALLAGADAILHAGDVLDGGVLEWLGRFAPLHAVLGNNDHDLVGVLPKTLEVELAGVRVAMVHDSGPAAGRAGRLHRWFPDARIVVFGHSHAPMNEVGEAGQLLFNPGSPTQRRRQPVHSLGQLTLEGGSIAARRIVALD